MSQDTTALVTSQQPLLVYEYNGRKVKQRPSDGYLYVSDMRKALGKLWKDYRKLRRTQRFLEDLSKDTGIPIEPGRLTCSQSAEKTVRQPNCSRFQVASRFLSIPVSSVSKGSSIGY